MQKTLQIILVILALLVAVYVIKNFFPAIYDELLLWVAGFMGFIAAGIKKLFGGSGSISDMQKENDRIKSEMGKIALANAENQKWIEKERALHEQEVNLLKNRIRQHEESAAEAQKQLEILKNQDIRKEAEAMETEDMLDILGKPVNP